MKRVIVSLILASFMTAIPQFSRAQEGATPFDKPPAWAKYAIWYQVFVERFHNGDETNDPMPHNINIPPVKMIAPVDWKVTPWTREWYAGDPWAAEMKKPFGEVNQYRRYGGDLQGVMNKLDYLEELGVNAIYFNPLNNAPTLHKYDARHYHHIDVNFGPDPAGDTEMMAGEKFDDPETWHWTSADKMFLMLIEECHRRGIRVIMDFSWNHTGVLFPAWQDILMNQENSAYKDWYDVKKFDDPETPGSEFSYSGWAGVDNLPELKKVNITGKRVSGYPYEGDINPEAKKHIFEVTRRWLAPNGDPSKGVDGFRLDVADQVGLIFWRDYRKLVRSVKPDAYLVGEIWWAKWPDKMMDPAPYCKGDIFDAVMYYQVYKPARYFFAKTSHPVDAEHLRDSLLYQWNRVSRDNLLAMMNVSSSHDAPRLLTDFYNTNKYKYHATPNDDSTYKTGKPDAETYQRLKLYLAHLFTTQGAPQIWNGEEMGMWGADDPHCRKPLWWPEYTFEPENRNNFQKEKKQFDPVEFNKEQFEWYKKLTRIRKENPVLSEGSMDFLEATGKKLAYKRSNGKEEIFILFNLEKTGQTFTLPKAHEYLDLLDGTRSKESSAKLEPMTCRILKVLR